MIFSFKLPPNCHRRPKNFFLSSFTFFMFPSTILSSHFCFVRHSHPNSARHPERHEKFIKKTLLRANYSVALFSLHSSSRLSKHEPQITRIFFALSHFSLSSGCCSNAGTQRWKFIIIVLWRLKCNLLAALSSFMGSFRWYFSKLFPFVSVKNIINM